MTEKQWNKLKPATKRVKIAQDVIDRIDSKQYKAEPKIWAKLSDFIVTDRDAPLQPIILQGQKCKCCALGGLLLSKVAVANKANCEVALWGSLDYDGNRDSEYDNEEDADEQSTHLRKIFDPEQLVLIEQAFELGRGAFYVWADGPDAERKAVQFGKRYKSPGPRLKAIMQNIVDNKGTFKP